MGGKICDTCRKKLAKEPAPLTSVPSVVSSSGSEAEEAKQYYEEKAISSMNKCFEDIGETPFSRRKARRKDYSKQKMTELTKALQDTTIRDDGREMIEQLKDKFLETTRMSEKLQILTVLPKSWSPKEIQQEFGVTLYMARKSKELVKEKGILSLPGPKLGHSLLMEIVDLVKSFYNSEDISRIMPGKKDYVSVKVDDKRFHVQKRLVLGNLKELHSEFQQKYPDVKVGFSKFAELRPKHCVLAGSSGTHAVCVCTIHQNVKLMLTAVGFAEFPTYHDCLSKVMCTPPLPECCLNECESCPGIVPLRKELLTALDENDIEQVIYKQWVSTDRSTLETYCASAEEFLESFCEKLEILCPHSFIAKQQASFYSMCKSNLKPGEVLVTVDFSENYSFVLQDAAQGFHWNNAQATIHPFVAYYMESQVVHHLSYVIISDCLHHDTLAVHLFQKHFIQFLRRHLPALSFEKVIYFSDGAASQYKNRKNFINLCYHQKDFGIAAEWHFSATSHGKGACDGLGGTVKRLAARASLQRPYNEQIMTPRQLFDWACSSISSAHFEYCSNEQYELERQNLEERFEQSRTIPGTRKLHSFVPLSLSEVRVRRYSASDTYRDENVSLEAEELQPEAIVGFVTCLVEEKWWLACVLEVIEQVEVKLTLLHPHGPSRSFKYPAKEDVHIIPVQNIFITVDPRTVSGRTYTLSKEEFSSTTMKFSNLSKQ